MAKTNRTPKPNRNATDLEKAAWLWDQYDRAYARFKRTFARLERIRQRIARLGKRPKT